MQTTTNKTLQNWHEREIFDAPEIVNGAFSPVFLGDVFEVTHNQKLGHFGPAGQPCDLMIRDTGERKSSEALFLLVTAEQPKNETFGYRFEFPGVGIRWIRYGDAFAVNLNLLDIVSYRSDGKMVFNGEVKASPRQCCQDWQKKLQQLTSSFRALYKSDGQPTGAKLHGKYLRLALSGLRCLETNVKDRQIAFPMARIGRIRSPHAEAILGGLAVHNTRVAFEYNFADLSEYCKVCDESAGECKINP